MWGGSVLKREIVLFMLFIVFSSVVFAGVDKLEEFEKKLFSSLKEKNVWKLYYERGKSVLKISPVLAVDRLQKAWWINPNKDVALSLIYAYIKAKMYKRAVEFYKEAKKMVSTMSTKEANIFMARYTYALFRLGKIEEARRIIRDLLRKSSDRRIKRYAEAILGKSDLIADQIAIVKRLIENEKFEEARSQLADLTRLYPEDKRLLELVKKLNEAEKRKILLKKAAKLADKNPEEAAKLLAKVEKSSNGSEKNVEENVDKISKKIALSKAVSKRNDGEAYYKKMLLAIQDGKWNLAHEYLNKAEMMGYNIPNLKWLRLKILLLKYKNASVFIFAVVLIAIVLMLTFGRTEYEVVSKQNFVERIERLIKRGKYEDAEELIHEFLRLAPTNEEKAEAYKYLAFVNFEMKRLSQALDYVNIALRYLPMDPELISLAGRIYLLKGERSLRAIEVFEKLLKQDPDNPNYLKALVESYLVSGNFSEEAAERAKQLLIIEPTNKSAILLLAKFYIRYGLVNEESLAIVERAAQKFESDWNLQQQLAIFYYRLAKWDKAISQAKYVLMHNPNLVEMHRILYNSYIHKKELSRLLEEYRTFYQKFPYSRIVQEILAELEAKILGKVSVQSPEQKRFVFCRLCGAVNLREEANCSVCGAELA